jgi:hypothetical protein
MSETPRTRALELADERDKHCPHGKPPFTERCCSCLIDIIAELIETAPASSPVRWQEDSGEPVKLVVVNEEWREA